MPHYLSISSSEFNARYNKLATYLSFDINANKPFSEIINELKNLFSSDAEILRTQADLDRKLFVLNRDENHKTFLHKAAAENNIRSLIFLRETGHDIDLTDGIHRTALYVACDQLKLISVQTLLRFGANPNKGNTQLVGGIRGDRTPLNAVINSELIDDRLVDINPDYERIAANIVKKLIAAGADVNLQTGNENFSAVHRAIINRKPLILQEIISSGKANFDLVNIDGETVLHMLVDYRSKDEKAREQPQMQEEKQMLDLLIPHIKSIDKQDKNGDTALHKAVTNSNVAVVEALYKKDHLFSGDEKLLSIQNNLGDTAIHEAIREAQRGPKILELLLRVATENDLSIKNNAGETAKEMAARLFKQANTIQNLAQTIANTAKNLDDSLHETEIDEVDLLRDINQLKEAIIKLNNHELNSQETLHSKASKALSLAIEGLLIDMDEITSLSNADPEDLVIRAQQLVADSTREFFEETYLTALKSVQQTEYLDWKNEKLRLPSSFSNLEVIDPNLQINPQVLNPVVNQPAEDVEMLDLDNLPINDLYGYRDLPEPRVNQENHDAMHIDDLDNIDLDDMAHTVGCVTTRRKREVGCVLDSEKIIEKLNIFPEEKQFEILQKLEIQKPNIGGNKQKEVTALIHNHRVTQHLEKIGRFSSSLIDMMFSEEAVANLLFKGDPTAAVKLAGLNIVNHGLLKASELLEKKRLLALATGMKDLGFGLGARVVTKGTSLLAGYDLFNQIKFLQNNSNDTDAKVAIASDGIQIGTDLLRGGIEVAEISSERFAAMGISIVAGPVGEIVVGMVMLGQRIYDKVEYVEEEKHHVRLSDWEKFKEGSRAFLFINPEAYISRMIQKATEYEHRLALQSQLFQKNLAIKHIIIPGIERNGEKCRVVAEKSSCGDTRSIFITTCTKNVTICDPIFTDIINNSVYFQDKLEGFQLTRLIIKPPEGNELLCVPIETDGNGIVLTEHAYACDDAIGLTNTNNTVGEIAYFNLGLGEDHAVGFTDIPNVFITNNGAKDFEGGEQDDSFIVQATQVWTGRPKDREGMGGLDGGPGSDSLFLEGFQPITDRIKVYFDDGDAGYLKYGNTTLATNRIEKLFGGTIPLDVTAACTTEEIGMLGGTTLNNSDTLLIPKNSSCDYNLKMHLRPNSNVTNEAEVGNFIYYILPGNGIASISVAQNNLNTQHQFVFNASISEISSLVFSDNQQPQVTKLHFIQGMQFQLNTNLSASTNLYFMEGKTSAELKRGYKNLYLFLTTDQSIENIMQIYPAIAHRLNMISIINTSRNETVVIGHNGQEVMQNNPSAKKTYLNGNGGEGLFVMDNGSADSFRPPLNEVVIYHAKNDTHIDSLDFRKLHAKIQKLNATAEVFFTAPNKRNKLGNDVLLQLVMHPKNSLRRIRVMDIYLKDALVNHWYKKFLHILLDVAPYKIAGPRLNLHLKPVSFPVNADSMSIGVKNIEEKTEMIIPSDHDLHNFAFYHDNRTNLIFTNSLSNSSDIVKPLTILFENFYAEPKLATLVIKFSNTNTKIRLKNKVTLKGIADFNQVWQARKHALQADSSAIIKGQRNFTSIHKNVTDTQVWQRYYISNDINASSIEALTDDNYVEDNELRLSRRRRSIERSAQPLHSNAAAHHNGIIQKTFKAVNSVMNSLFSSNFEDKILDMADHYEKSQYPIKALSKGAKHSRRKAVKLPLKQVNDSTKQKILESPRQVQNLVLSNKTFKKTDRIQAHKKSAAAETCKRTSLFKPVQTNESYNPQNTRGNKQNSYANHNQIKLDPIASGNLHKIGHQTKQLHSKLLVKASLAGENHQHSYQQARQQAGKSGISQVTATSNVNATLLLFNVMSRYKCQQPLNAKVVRWSEQVDRQKQKISGRPMGLRL